MTRLNQLRGAGETVLRSYSLLFFSQHRGFAGLLLAATFLRPGAGLAGLLATGLAVGLAYAGGFDRDLTRLGAYSFNALLVGLALGTFYQLTPGFWPVLGLGAGLAFLLAVGLSGWLGKHGLPILSLPFVLTMWLLVPAAEQFCPLVPDESGIYWLNTAYALGGEPLAALVRRAHDWPLPPALTTYLRALSAVLFQDSVGGGLLVAAGLLWHSRIAFVLSVLAGAGAYGFVVGLGGAPVLLPAYDLGANYMLTALAVGGVFLVPSGRSFAVALTTVPVVAVLVAGLGKMLGGLGLPLFSLPFCGAALLLLYGLLLRTRPDNLPLTPVQAYSPERNLYAFRNNQVRLRGLLYHPLRLPFRGTWRVTQGYHGQPTHQGDWAQALDFMVTDADGRTYQGTGTALTDYYCYGKPILAPADGVVESVVMHLPDNAPGTVNTQQNWGNTLVIKHQPGLYTKLAHLRPHSAQVAVGDFVRRGDVVAYCGNSGRSAEPHLHWQAQATPYVGSRTLAYPLACFLQADAPALALHTYAVPDVDTLVSHPEANRLLEQAFLFQPGYVLVVRSATEPDAPPQRWESFTDAYNQLYLQCHTTGAVAYFERNDLTFYFTAYYGSPHAWLYHLYRAAYRVPLTYLPHATIHDTYPLSTFGHSALKWMQDVVAPFFLFVHPRFTLRYSAPDNPHHPRTMEVRSCATMEVAGRPRSQTSFILSLAANHLVGLTVEQPGRPPLRLLCATPNEATT